MLLFGRISLFVLIAVALTAGGGCSPGDSGQMDDEKEPHFVLGNSRCDERDWPGAIDAFAQSLEVNPHSAAAHYRLAVIFDTQQPDPAAAIYHYQQYLKLDPDAKNSDVINERIRSCKMQLATDVNGLPASPAMQKQLETLIDKNNQLQSEVDKLNAQLREWSAYYARVNAAGNNNAGGVSGNAGTAQPVGNSAMPDDISTQSAQSGQANPQPQAQLQPQPRAQSAADGTPKPVSTKPPRSHTHIVASGETMASIARKHGISLTVLEEANPGINPKKLHVGQPVILPP